MIQDMFALQSVPLAEMCLRLLLAVAAGFVFGLDRDLKNKPIDSRVYMIVCVASALLAITSVEMAEVMSGENGVFSVDPARTIQGVMIGIGFLGAGSIIQKSSQNVVGMATGASIWASAGLGVAVGLGYYGLFLACSLIIAVILLLNRRVIKNLFGFFKNDKK
jgi:putative Mg2+ transporter-C (MgtC) family protein